MGKWNTLKFGFKQGHDKGQISTEKDNEADHPNEGLALETWPRLWPLSTLIPNFLVNEEKSPFTGITSRHISQILPEHQLHYFDDIFRCLAVKKESACVVVIRRVPVDTSWTPCRVNWLTLRLSALNSKCSAKCCVYLSAQCLFIHLKRCRRKLFDYEALLGKTILFLLSVLCSRIKETNKCL